MKKTRSKITKAVLTDDGVVMHRNGEMFEALAGKTDWQRLAARTDDELDYSDIPELTEAFWLNTNVSMPEPKKQILIRLDSDLLEWLKKGGRGYQTRINAILRAYMKAHNNTPIP